MNSRFGEPVIPGGSWKKVSDWVTRAVHSYASSTFSRRAHPSGASLRNRRIKVADSSQRPAVAAHAKAAQAIADWYKNKDRCFILPLLYTTAGAYFRCLRFA